MTPASIFVMLLAIILASAYGGYELRDRLMDKERLTWTQAIVEGQKAQAAAVSANEVTIREGEKKYAEAQKALNILLGYPVGRVHLPTCKLLAADGETAASGVGISAVESAGVLLAEAERVMGEDRRRTKGIIGEAETELNACRESKDWAAKQ